MPRYRTGVMGAASPDMDRERAILGAIGAEVVPTRYAPMTARVIQALDRCRGIVGYGVGWDTVDVQAARRQWIIVCNVPGRGAGRAGDGASPPDSPLLGLEQYMLIPHSAWGSNESAAAFQRLAVEETVRLLRGQPPRGPVDDAAGAKRA